MTGHALALPCWQLVVRAVMARTTSSPPLLGAGHWVNTPPLRFQWNDLRQAGSLHGTRGTAAKPTGATAHLFRWSMIRQTAGWEHPFRSRQGWQCGRAAMPC